MNTYVVVLILFMVTLIVIGWRAAIKKKETIEDYFVAGRSMNKWVVAGTYGASFISAGSFLGTLGYNYAYGWAAAWQLVGTLTALFLLSTLLAKKFWRFGYHFNGCSMPDLISHRYPSKWSRGIYAGIILAIYVVGMASMYMGIYTVLSLVSDLPYMACILIGAVVVTIYTYTGGARAVAWTDTACMTIMLLAITITLIVCLNNGGGFVGLTEQFGQAIAPEGSGWQEGASLVSKTNSYLTFSMSLAWFMVWMCGNLSQPHQITRMYLAKDERTARNAIAIVMIPFTLIYIGGLIIASYARVEFPNLAKIDQAFPTVVMDIFPTAIAAIVLMGIVAAIISTASTMLIISSQCTSYDIYQKLIKPEASEATVLKISRVTIIICSILAVAVAYFAQTVSGLIFLWSSAFAMMGAGVLPSLIGAFYWKRANVPANLASMLTGFISVIIMYLVPAVRPFGLHPVLPGLVLSIAVFVIVALATKKPDDEVIDKFFGDALKDKKQLKNK